MIPTKPRVYLGSAGVFLGAGIVSLGQRLLSAGLPDLRGALGIGIDEAAWIPTSYNMALMFMGAFTVYLGGFMGTRRVLLWAAGIFTGLEIILPFAPNVGTLIALQVLAGLASGTFYPLALSFALRSLPPRYTIYGIGAYSMELLATLSLATPLQALTNNLPGSWRWIFWCCALLTPVMMTLIHFAVPPQPPSPGPRPHIAWHGFFWFSTSLALFEGALEQGERLDWLGSGTIVGMLVGGGFLFVMGFIARVRRPNPLVDFGFLWQRNIVLLGVGLFVLRFTLLAMLVLIPGYLGAVQGYRSLETGHVLLWLAVPVLLAGTVAARFMKWIEGRLVASVGLALIATACLMDAQLTSDWAADQYFWPQLVLAVGLGTLFVGQVGLIAQQALATGAIIHPVQVMTFAAFFQVSRLFGGQIGVSFMQRLLAIRTTFHTSSLARSLPLGDFLTDERLRALTSGYLPGSSGAEDAQGRAAAALISQLGRQAVTLSYTDGFTIIAWVCAGMMLVYAFLRPTRRYFDTTARSLAEFR